MSGYSKIEDHGRPVKPAPRRADSKTAEVSKTLDNVTKKMHSNIVKATERGTKLKDLEDQTEQLEASGNSFYKTSGDVKKMFQWKAFLWQLAFAAVILVILAVVTLYILSATGILDDDGSTVIVAAPTNAPPVADASTALFSLSSEQSADKGQKLSDLGQACSLGISAIVRKCAQGLTCVMGKEGAVEGICQKEETTDDSTEASGGCQKGEVRCTDALRESGQNCILGRCVVGTSASRSPSKTVAETHPGPKSVASAPLTGASMVYKTNGESAGQVESEIREALVTLHRHAADCAVGILHKDCTLDLLMQGWGVAS